MKYNYSHIFSMGSNPVIAVDFDGTCVKHAYPEMGEDVPGAVQCLKRLVLNRAALILYTMRSGPELDAAVAWFESHSIRLWAVNTNPTQKRWTSSNKTYAELYIDDAALGVPLVVDPTPGVRPWVDWYEVSRLLWPSSTLSDTPSS